MKQYTVGTRRSLHIAGACYVEAPRIKSTDANLFGHVVDRETHEHIPALRWLPSVHGSVRFDRRFGTLLFPENLLEGELTLEVRAWAAFSETDVRHAEARVARR